MVFPMVFLWFSYDYSIDFTIPKLQPTSWPCAVTRWHWAVWSREGRKEPPGVMGPLEPLDRMEIELIKWWFNGGLMGFYWI